MPDPNDSFPVGPDDEQQATNDDVLRRQLDELQRQVAQQTRPTPPPSPTGVKRAPSEEEGRRNLAMELAHMHRRVAHLEGQLSVAVQLLGSLTEFLSEKYPKSAILRMLMSKIVIDSGQG